MPAAQITNPLNAFATATPTQAFTDGQLTVEVQNNSTADIFMGQWVVGTVVSSSFYPAAYTVKPTTDISQGSAVLGVAVETIPAVQATTQTTGSVTNVAQRFATGSVCIYGIAWAAIAGPPGTSFSVPNYLTPATTGNASIQGSTQIRGIATATTTGVGTGLFASSSANVGGIMGVAIAGSSVALTNSSQITGSTALLYPVKVVQM